MTKATPFDTAQYLTDPETIRHYLAQTFEAGHPTLIRSALGANS
jgi:DNA-binding phage protein